MESNEYFECPICHTRSYNQKDIENKYCGRCHCFSKDIIMPDGRPQYAWENEIKMLRRENTELKNSKNLCYLQNLRFINGTILPTIPCIYELQESVQCAKILMITHSNILRY